MQEIKKPIQRSLLRSKLGKQYYILKRKLKWYFGKENFSKKELYFLMFLIKHSKMCGQQQL